MEKDLQRREFLKRTALLTGGVLLAAGPVAAAPAAQKLTGYVEVDPVLFQGINRAAGKAGEKTVLEKKHAPQIEVPAQIKAGEPFAVTVTIGEIIHPMTAAHYIGYIEMLAGNEPAGRMELRPGFNAPKATFFLALEKPVTLVVRQYCNLHGLWESRKEVTPN